MRLRMTMPGGPDERPGAAGSYASLIESRLKRRLAARFREYVPPVVVARIALDPERYDSPRAPSSQF